MRTPLNFRSARRTMIGGVFVAALVVGGVASPATAVATIVATPVGAGVSVSAAVLGAVSSTSTYSSVDFAGETYFDAYNVLDAYPSGVGIVGAGDLIYTVGTTATLGDGSTITTCLEFDPVEIGNVVVALYVNDPTSGLWVDGTTSNPTPDSACIVENKADWVGEYLPVFTPAPIVPLPLPIVTDDYELSVEPGFGPMVLDGEVQSWAGDMPILQLRFSNLTDSPVALALALDLEVEGVPEPLWLAETWGGEGINAIFAAPVAPGENFAWDIPDWAGKTYSFYLLQTNNDDGQLLGIYHTSGGFVPVVLDFDAGIFEMGREATVSGSGATPEVFPGVTATVSAAGLNPGDELELWLAPGFDYFWFYFTGAVLPVNAVNVGSGVVGPDGSLTATFEVPANTPLGSYQLMVGDPATRFWPAGTYSSFQVTLPSSSGSAAFDGNSPVTVDLGATGVTFTGQSGAGTVTASVSTTGPILNGFLFASSPQLYYHLSSTVAPSAPVLVCITYDPLTLQGEAPYLYHYVAVPGGYEWQNITTTRTEGYVCGTTTSFSPFTLGYPVEGQPLNKEGCKDGGWELSALPVFSNQGTCVSYFVAATKK